MTLDVLLLQRVANWRPDSTRSPLVVDHDASGWRVQLSLRDANPIGVQALAIEFQRLRPLLSAPPLDEQARRLAQQVTGLLEPLQLIEMDASNQVAQLRSNKPADDANGVRYYEMLRHADGTTRLQRYQANGNRREAVEFTLTLDALGKLTRDVTN
ncbi:MAG: hypothetical protein SNJ75_02265 [Gemmataceae bacterium]